MRAAIAVDRVKRIKPGDRCILECDSRLSMDAQHELIKKWQQRMPGTHAIILDAGIRLTRVLSLRHRKLGRMPSG